MTIETCRLCGEKKELRRSHILPEFFYAEMYDDKNRTLEVNSSEIDKPRIHQKGLRQRLLCGDCETQFSRYESYAAPIIKTIPTLSPTRSGYIYPVINVDYKLFKLFQMSFLWRACLSNHSLFQMAEIGGLEPRLQRMLRDEKPGKAHNFGCMMLIRPSTKYLVHTIFPVVQLIGEGRKVLRFITGEILWLFPITSTPRDHIFRKAFLSEDGRLQLLLSPWTEQHFMDEMLRNLKGV